MRCKWCDSEEGVELESARTAYARIPAIEVIPEEEKALLSDSMRRYFEKKMVDNPSNAPVPLCRPCAKEHHEYWDGMWEEYYAGCM